ncbi:nitrite reductase small subunit NirD [Jiella marina]|uniref:nitrite reductase small subunit NirD n=1 Tax=Jiella sp. LLJ827 TaxID=2917712 RepID=UPI002100E06A|nr:nitrite reductase small subunit NirD [Jiella sp. LLJ827]MCQ0988801.1 nitrite reductase small subunit NirD [Jiella sp. LLJ827]
MTTPAWYKIGLVTDIPKRGARCLNTPLGRVAVFRTADDRVFAMEDRCPHKGGPLSQGIVHDRSVTCPLHNAVISLESGEMKGPDEGTVKTFAIRIDAQSQTIEISFDAVAAEPFVEAAE